MITKQQYRKVRTAILISGRGSNMEALVKAAESPDYPAQIVSVISNRPNAGGLKAAQNMGIDTLCIDHKNFETREAFETALHAALLECKAELVCCAGFMRVLTPWLTSRWSGRMINIHPSLLPKYKGLNTHRRTLENGDKVHGCTVHYVTEDLDGGSIIGQAEMPIQPGDTAQSLAEKLIPFEHKLYVKSLKNTAQSLQSFQ